MTIIIDSPTYCISHWTPCYGGTIFCKPTKCTRWMTAFSSNLIGQLRNCYKQCKVHFQFMFIAKFFILRLHGLTRYVINNLKITFDIKFDCKIDQKTHNRWTNLSLSTPHYHNWRAVQRSKVRLVTEINPMALDTNTANKILIVFLVEW